MKRKSKYYVIRGTSFYVPFKDEFEMSLIVHYFTSRDFSLEFIDFQSKVVHFLI
ncbi:hypothetical protein [Sigmofec virus UA08Rod_4687]|uniref:Uncharacterized protein n=1 Tax=Sigmofec virus UA08Rod_4687 TaxID=2929407 RepID=A0A976N2F7_9VIRU|nr:hypothetical protein [Sigmofec virus UA08Rod_4687]